MLLGADEINDVDFLLEYGTFMPGAHQWHRPDLTYRDLSDSRVLTLGIKRSRTSEIQASHTGRYHNLCIAASGRYLDMPKTDMQSNIEVF